MGSLAWARSVQLRASRASEFAVGTLPGWPVTTYALLTTGGPGLLGAGLLAGGFLVWPGWVILTFIASARGLALTAVEHGQLAQMRAARMAEPP